MYKITDTRRPVIMFGGINRRIRDYIVARREFKKFKYLSDKAGGRFPVLWEDIFFFSRDHTSTTWFNTHYVYHTGWAARAVRKIAPKEHIDISSSLYFLSITSAFIPIRFYDYRPANLKLSNLTSGNADLTSLPFKDKSISSLSCMHVVEHIGLGRYGDPLDPDGDLKAIYELKRVLAPGGNLLFVVPVGKPKLQFNGQRIYSYNQIMDYFKDLELEEFFLVPDHDIALAQGPIENATKEDADKQSYGCGCFWFKKIK